MVEDYQQRITELQSQIKELSVNAAGTDALEAQVDELRQTLTKERAEAAGRLNEQKKIVDILNGSLAIAQSKANDYDTLKSERDSYNPFLYFVGDIPSSA